MKISRNLTSRTKLLLWSFAFSTLIWSQPAVSCEVIMGIPGNAPFTELERGKIRGVIAEAANEALRNMGCRAKGQQIPFPRMYKWVHDGRLGMATSVLKTPTRAKLAHYSLLIITEYTVVMVPKGRAFPMNKPSDLQEKRIGARLGFKYPPLEGSGIKLMRERSYEVNIRKVAGGRIDGTLIGSITGPYLAQRLALADKVEFLPKALGKVELGVALSRQLFNEEANRRFQIQITQL